MQTFVAIFTGSILLFILGVVLFIYNLRTRRRWAWAVAVTLMTLGVFGVTMWWQ